MCRYILVTTFILFSFSALSQSLEGEWKGSFSSNEIYDNETSFALHFTLKKDSSYKVYSYSLLPEGEMKVTVVCRMICKMIGSDSLYLEEIEQVKPQKIITACFQTMHLQINLSRREKTLTGTWETKGERCKDSGTISLRKID